MKILYQAWLVAIVFFCVTNFCYSQSSLSCVVLNKDLKPVPNATIRLLKKDKATIKFQQNTDSLGFVSMPGLEPGSYLIECHSVGYKNYLADVNLFLSVKGNKKINLIIQDSTIELKEVTIQTSQPVFQQNLDRITVNVQQNPIMSNGTVLGALAISPGVIVDNAKNTISLNGNPNVTVMFNGKLTSLPQSTLVQMLKGMGAANVAKIEIIANPPAEFDAEGNGGIINIITSKPLKTGINGNYNVYAGYGNKEKAGADFNLMYGGKKINIYNDFSYFHDRTFQFFDNQRVEHNKFNEEIHSINSIRNPLNNNFYENLQLDYQADSLTKIGLTFNGFLTSWNMNALNTVISDQSLVMRIPNLEHNNWTNATESFYINRKLTKNSSLNLESDYLYYYNSDPTDYLNHNVNSNGEIGDENQLNIYKNSSLKSFLTTIDYSLTASKSVTIKSGMKLSMTLLDNDVQGKNSNNGISSIDSNVTNRSKYNENITAAYTELNTIIDNRTRLNIGVRYEFSNTWLTVDGATAYNRELGRLFPTAFFSRSFNKKLSLQLSYGMRITRPSFNDLAPYIVFLDPTTYFYGNVYLKPSFTSIYKCDLILNPYVLSFQYNHASSAINTTQASIDPSTGDEVLTSYNLDFLNTATVSLSFPVKLANWWETNLNFLVINQNIKTNNLNENVQLRQTYLKLNVFQNITIPDNYSFYVSTNYQSKKLSGISTIYPRGTLEVGIQKKFKENTLRLSLTDILNSNSEKDITYFPTDNLDIIENYHFESRIFRISFVHKFGHENKKERQHLSTSDEIKDRMN